MVTAIITQLAQGSTETLTKLFRLLLRETQGQLTPWHSGQDSPVAKHRRDTASEGGELAEHWKLPRMLRGSAIGWLALGPGGSRTRRHQDSSGWGPSAPESSTHAADS